MLSIGERDVIVIEPVGQVTDGACAGVVAVRLVSAAAGVFVLVAMVVDAVMDDRRECAETMIVPEAFVVAMVSILRAMLDGMDRRERLRRQKHKRKQPAQCSRRRKAAIADRPNADTPTHRGPHIVRTGQRPGRMPANDGTPRTHATKRAEPLTTRSHARKSTAANQERSS
ncbi:MAG: hypothetical protein AAGC56_14800 [Pseudomonadota bacterium]